MNPTLAHQGFATPGTLWSLDAAAVLPPLVALALVAAFALRTRRAVPGTGGDAPHRLAGLCAGAVVVVLAVMSPLHELADALFAAHMVQHLLLVALAAPLLVFGAPVAIGGPRPTDAWPLWALPAASALLVVTFTMWHAPALYEAALGNVVVHGLEHATMLGAALLHWAAVAAAHSRRHDLTAVAVIAIAGLPGVALGALLALSPTAWYPGHAGGAAAWGIDPLADQQLGGMVMWIVGGTANLAAAVVLVFRFLVQADRDRRPGPVPPLPLR